VARLEKDRYGEAIACNSLSKCYLATPFTAPASDDQDGENGGQGGASKALDFARLDLEISSEFGDAGQVGSARAQIAACLSAAGLREEAAAEYEKALALLLEAGDEPTALLAVLELGWMALSWEMEGGAADGGGRMAWSEWVLKLGKEALRLADRCNDKENGMLAKAMCVRTKTAEGDAMREDFARVCKELKVGEVEGGGGGGGGGEGGGQAELCAVCGEEMDRCAPTGKNEVFTQVRSCGHTHHEKCFLEWVGRDEVVCPVKSCGKVFRNWVKSDPGVVLRVAKGERKHINAF